MTDNSRHSLIGPVGHQVIGNIEELRKARGLSLRDLAARLAELGRPIGATVLHRLSQGRRRVDADDLVAFGRAFDVDPAMLLEHPSTLALADHPAIRAARLVVTQVEALVRVAGNPEAIAPASGYVDRAIRRLQLELEEVVTPSQPSGSAHEVNTRTLR